MSGAFETGIYRNVFAECGLPEEEIEKRVRDSFQTMFYGSEEERIYHEVGADMGYLTDTGNNDVRTEGMSYGMMMCVQLDKKEEFDRIWKWTKTYMYMDAETLKTHPTAAVGMKAILPGPARLTARKTPGARRRTGKNFSPWRFSSLPTAGETAKGFSIIPPRRAHCSTTVYIKGNSPAPESLCGTRRTI